MSERLPIAVAIPGFLARAPAGNAKLDAAVTTTIRFLATEEEWNTPPVQRAWRELLANTANPDALFATPEWFESKHKTKREDLRVAVVVDSAEITGVAPLLLGEQEFDLELCRRRLQTAQLLGGEGMLREGVYESLFEAIFQAFDVDAIHFRLLPIESPCWKAVQSSRAGLVHVHDQFKMYSVNLPHTFDEYLETRFDSSHRRNLRHRVKLLREQGELGLQRITAPEDVPEFLRVGGQVARASWQATSVDYLIQETPEWSAHLSDLAKCGLLRSYLLWCGSTPCAYALGFQGRGSYHHSFAGYHPSMAKFSTGTVLLLQIIEDLIQYDPPETLNFGEGEDEYKRRFATEVAEVANVTMLRRSILGHVRASGLVAYRSLRDLRRRGKERAEHARDVFAKRRRAGRTKGKVQAARRHGQRWRAALFARYTGRSNPETSLRFVEKNQLDATTSPVPAAARGDGSR